MSCDWTGALPSTVPRGHAVSLSLCLAVLSCDWSGAWPIVAPPGNDKFDLATLPSCTRAPRLCPFIRLSLL